MFNLLVQLAFQMMFDIKKLLAYEKITNKNKNKDNEKGQDKD